MVRTHTKMAAAAAATDSPARAIAARRDQEHQAVVKRVAAAKEAVAAAGITFDGRGFRVRGTRLPGLTKSLKQTLWSRYEYTPPSAHFRRADSSIRRPSDGRARGTAVHRQLELMTNDGGAGALKKRHEVSQPFTRKILLAMKGWKWRPVTSELPLADVNAGFATAADMICSAPGRGGRLILVEVKNGYHGSWDSGKYPMEGPLRGLLSDSPRNQAHVQLLMTWHMLKQLGVRVDGAYVVRAHPNGVDPEAVFPELQSRAGLVAAHVGERIRALRRRRARRR